MNFACGVVIGKFLPPHRGHGFLIETALSRAERVIVIVCAKPTDPIPGVLRAEWLRELHPGATVMVIDDRYDAQDSRVWAENTVRWLGRAPDVVFTSEDYGDRYARLMGSAHVLVDRQRTQVPCSATMIRADPYAHWDFLPPPVRAWYASRVCVLGAESTGTTTMAKALAEHYQTAWVAEYGREWSEEKLRTGDVRWRSEEFEAIAKEQNRREDAAARTANRVLICDTNSFATVLWHRRYMGSHNDRVAQIAARGKCDLYLLTGDDIPFVQDGLRDGEHIRHEMHAWFVEALRAQPTPWLLLTGSHESRCRAAIGAVNALFQQSAWNVPLKLA